MKFIKYMVLLMLINFSNAEYYLHITKLINLTDDNNVKLIVNNSNTYNFEANKELKVDIYIPNFIKGFPTSFIVTGSNPHYLMYLYFTEKYYAPGLEMIETSNYDTKTEHLSGWCHYLPENSPEDYILYRTEYSASLSFIP